MMLASRVRLQLLFCVLSSLIAVACGKGGKDCGKNVAEVIQLSFDGPSIIPASAGWAGYNVSATIRKVKPNEDARLCYVVRDDDSWIKLFWAVDDVLDANTVYFSSSVESRRLEGQFLLENDDGEVCGAGALPGDLQVKGCSGEAEAEVYIQPVTEADGPVGPETARRNVRVP